MDSLKKSDSVLSDRKAQIGHTRRSSKLIGGANKMQSSVKKLQAVKQLSSQDKVTKFEFLIDLQRMDAKIDKTSIFRAQIRLVGVFKQMSKKYEVVQPHQDGQTLEALIEF